MDLFPFQIEASTKIAQRFSEYAVEPLFTTKTKVVPFYQNLSAITGSGKTPVLADSISQIRSQLPAEPIVLWLSKGKVVVWQTFNNLVSGKYAELVSNFTVKPLMECKHADIENSKSGLILVATAAKFNQKDKNEGDRKVYQLALDFADMSLWEMLKKRTDDNGVKRPFIVVYDEGHNLSNQQTELLLELNPDALIAASATMRVPDALSPTISRLKQDKKWNDNDFATVVKSSEVVESGLIKQKILLGGYVTPMEIAIDEMLESLKRTEESAEKLGLPFKPKAIYVSNTNVVSGGNNTDNVHQPFEQRQARPILIWRYLVEHKGVDPATIAVYCNLKFDSKSPPPLNFNLFAGGDKDYDNFISGNYQHVIFNLSLQEGWDDPACYFAYIDKEMGSKEQITQVIGRVLRQPQATHYTEPSLNTAHFYIRTDEKSIFEEVLKEVRTKIAAEAPEINLTVFTGSKGTSNKLYVSPNKVQLLPEVSIDSTNAIEPIRKIISSIHDYKTDTKNTIGKGGRIQILQTIGSSGKEQQEWTEIEHSNRVTARWVFAREIQKTYSKAINLCDIEHEKFDALVEYNSPAAEHMREAARKIVTAYIENSAVTQNFSHPIEVPSVAINPDKSIKFTSSLHESYSDLNSLEEGFAVELDKANKLWFRNPSKGLFEIPLLTKGGSKNFNPDFVVFDNQEIMAIDTKGDHLIVEDAGKKLFYLNKVGDGPNVSIRLVTKGTWNKSVEKENNNGFTVWKLKQGKAHPFCHTTMTDAVSECLKS